MNNDIKHYESCVKRALINHGLDGENLEQAGLRVFKRYGFNPQAIFAAVGKGGIIMPVIGCPYFDPRVQGMTYSVILKVNRATKRITLYNPITAADDDKPLDVFIEQWQNDGGDCISAFRISDKTFTPQISSIEDINLSAEFDELREKLAEQAHNIWAMERQSEGWTYGPHRDDHRLETPDMRPYSELPETEKRYDRLMATGTLKYLTDLGYTITKKM